MKLALEQVKKLSLSTECPVIISDVDEVILHFSDMLGEFLKTQGMYINFNSYALEGNIKYIDSDQPVAHTLFGELINIFFDRHVEQQTLVDGAVENLARLSENCEIVILTNIPHIFAERRRNILLEHKLAYPMISNSGPKGPVIREISKLTSQKLVFIDDVSHHHHSVAENVPNCLRIQYIANEQLNAIEEKAEYCHYRCQNWPEITQIIEQII